MNKKSFFLEVTTKYRMICRKSKKNLKYIQNENRKLITVVKYMFAKKIVLFFLVVTKEANYYIKIYIRGQKDFG
jgi:hypothetical protein